MLQYMNVKSMLTRVFVNDFAWSFGIGVPIQVTKSWRIPFGWHLFFFTVDSNSWFSFLLRNWKENFTCVFTDSTGIKFFFVYWINDLDRTDRSISTEDWVSEMIWIKALDIQWSIDYGKKISNLYFNRIEKQRTKSLHSY